jgi:putative selenate reductase
VRTARRFTGRPITLLYRRTRLEMPAAAEELEGALEEGNVLEELVTPVEILREGGRVVGVRCVRNALGEPGPDGRRSPVPIAGSEFVVACDSVVVAVGQLPELAFLDGSGVTRHAGGGVLVDPVTRCAGPDGVFAGGDVVIEPGSIISACADGLAAAAAICERLGAPFAGRPWQRPTLSERDILAIKPVRARRVQAERPRMLPASERGGFRLIESTLSDAEAREEALRCVQCTTFCDKCVEVCPNRANYTFAAEPVHWALPLLAVAAGAVGVAGQEAFRVTQNRQIVHVDDFCNECDNCQAFCVHRGRPYADKPRLFLDAASFAAEYANAFRIEGATIRRRERGEERRLSRGGAGWVYDDGVVRIMLADDWRVVEAVALSPWSGTRSLRGAAEMAVLWGGVTRSLPFLLVE